ncbi:rCG58381 [Rattus norvegicus]|uniref:RCG58381 n=1 Tax=Rattus norvegicus TaxID=10116 RepID=A6J3U4_RAT|nr:rCG58381 [Rattus norvegicus]
MAMAVSKAGSVWTCRTQGGLYHQNQKYQWCETQGSQGVKPSPALSALHRNLD